MDDKDKFLAKNGITLAEWYPEGDFDSMYHLRVHEDRMTLEEAMRFSKWLSERLESLTKKEH